MTKKCSLGTWDSFHLFVINFFVYQNERIYPQVGLPGPIGTVWEDHPTVSWVSYFLPLA